MNFQTNRVIKKLISFLIFSVSFSEDSMWMQYLCYRCSEGKIFLKNSIQAQSEISRKSNRSPFPLSANQFFFFLLWHDKLPNMTDPQMLFVHVPFWTKPDFTFFLEMIIIIPHFNVLKDKPNF